MTTTEGAALSHLRDLYYILTHDLASAQLDDLAAANKLAQPASGVTPTGTPDQLAAAAPISPIIARIAPTAVLFSNAVEAAANLTSSGIRSSFHMIVLVWVLILTVTGMAVAMIALVVLKGYRERHMDFEMLVPSIGKILLVWLAGLGLLEAWRLMLGARYAELTHYTDVLKVGYWHLHNVVGGAYAIRFADAVQAGTLQDFVSQPYHSDGSTLVPGQDCADDSQVYDAQPCGNQISGCTADVPTLDTVIWRSCTDEIFTLLSTLQTIKTEGVDSYDRVAMWASISAGIEVIRGTIAMSANADTSAPAASAVPMGSTPASAGTAASTPGTPAFPATDVTPASPAIPAVGVQSIAPLDVIASFHPIMQAVSVSKQAKNLADEPGTPSAADAGVRAKMHPGFDRMVGQILALVQVLPYKMNITDHRDMLEASLSTYYKTVYPKIRFELLSVIAQVQKALDAAKPTGAVMYVDAPTLVARVAAMGASAWRDVVNGTDTTKQTVHSFLTRFKLPATQPSPTVKVATMTTQIFALGGFVVLIMYVTAILGDLFQLRLDSQVAARYILVAACAYALAVVLSRSMVDRMGYRTDHNWASLSKNGQNLNYSLSTTEEAARVIESATTVLTSQAQSYIDASAETVKAYDDCNSVTNGASVMPFPTMELVVYATVVVVVVASAIYGIMELNPSQKLANIRILRRLRERINDGEAPGGLEKQLECCGPGHNVWQIMMWLAVMIMFCINIFVMGNVQKTDKSYLESLILQASCV